MKLRIIKVIHNVGDKKLSKTTYYIQKKSFWGWKDIEQTEIFPKSLPYDTYKEAEDYMFSNYFGNGKLTQNGNVYHYEPYLILW